MRLVRLGVLIGVIALGGRACAPSTGGRQSPLPVQVLSLSLKPRRARSSSRPIPTEAPKTVARSSSWCDKRFYNGQRVHRVVKDFVVQSATRVARL